MEVASFSLRVRKEKCKIRGRVYEAQDCCRCKGGANFGGVTSAVSGLLKLCRQFMRNIDAPVSRALLGAPVFLDKGANGVAVLILNFSRMGKDHRINGHCS